MSTPKGEEEPAVPVIHLRGEDPAGILGTPPVEQQNTEGEPSIYIERPYGRKSILELRLGEFESIAVTYHGERLELDTGLLFERLRSLSR